jgi:hypothetical protein
MAVMGRVARTFALLASFLLLLHRVAQWPAKSGDGYGTLFISLTVTDHLALGSCFSLTRQARARGSEAFQTATQPQGKPNPIAITPAPLTSSVLVESKLPWSALDDRRGKTRSPAFLHFPATQPSLLLPLLHYHPLAPPPRPSEENRRRRAPMLPLLPLLVQRRQR